MNKKITRTVALLLSVFLLCPLFSCFGTLRTDAATEGTRFIFSGLRAGEREYAARNDAPLTVNVSAAQTSFTAIEPDAVADDGSTNALYIALVNTSNATGLRIGYVYVDAESNVPTQGQTKVQALEPHSDAVQSFVLSASHISRELSALTISFIFDGEASGTVTLRSLYDVSVYEDSFQYEDDATIEKCYYEAQTNTVEISGMVSHDATMLEGSLALFSLRPDEGHYLSNKVPVARVNISFSFRFSIPVESAEALYNRYVVAVITEDGLRVPLCTPIYPDIPADTVKLDIGFKGFHTDSLFTVIDSGADVEIVDVYLDRLQSTQNGGILYAGAKSYYYFDTAYVSELDRQVRNLTGAGCAVYLRFLISPNANGLPFVTYTEDANGIVNKGIIVNSEEALLALHAFTDFLTLRYREGAVGQISGIIVGRRADLASTYGYVGAMSLSDYTELYTASLNLVAGAARINIPQLQIIVPISDTALPEAMTAEALDGMYCSELFLYSLLEALETRTLNPASISVLLESDAVPDSRTYTLDRLREFLALLDSDDMAYDFLDEQILYAWTPAPVLDEEALCVAYALQYVSLALNDRVQSFLVDFSLTSDRTAAKALQHLATYIDTADFAEVTAPILELLGADSFEQLFAEYSEEDLATKEVLRLMLGTEAYASGAVPIGSYRLFDFSAATGVLDWYAGYACEDLSVLNRALTATMSATDSGEYAEIAHHFTGLKDYSFAPLIKLSVGLQGNASTPYEVQVRLLGEESTVIASTVMSSGGTHDFFLDLSADSDALSALRCVRVLARPLDGNTAQYTLTLHTVTLESTTLDDEALAERIAADLSAQQDADEGEKRDYTTPILVSVLVFGASVSIAAIVIIRYRNSHGRRKEKNIHTDESNE